MLELLDSMIVGGGDWARQGTVKEYTDLSRDDYNRLADLFLKGMPALQTFLDAGVVSKNDIATFFFKASTWTPSGGNGGGSSYRSSGYRSYGGGGYSYRSSGGGYRSSGGSSKGSNWNPFSNTSQKTKGTTPTYYSTPTRQYSAPSSGSNLINSRTNKNPSSGNNYYDYDNTPNVTPNTAKQKENRVYNIMKNWSF